MKRLYISSLTGLFLALVGVALLVFVIRSMRASEVATPIVSAAAANIAPKQTSAVKPTRIEGKPVRIDIPSLNISLPIIPGVYNEKTGQWTLTKDKAQYAVMSQLPNNEGGNTFIYGHYRKNVFAALHNIRSGEVAVVTTDNGRSFYYQFSQSRVVAPAQSEGVFDYEGAPILTVQTCTGVLFEKTPIIYI